MAQPYPATQAYSASAQVPPAASDAEGAEVPAGPVPVLSPDLSWLDPALIAEATPDASGKAEAATLADLFAPSIVVASGAEGQADKLPPHLPDPAVATAVSHSFHHEAAPVSQPEMPAALHAAPAAVDPDQDGFLAHTFGDLPGYASAIVHTLFRSATGSVHASDHFDSMAATTPSADLFSAPDTDLAADFVAMKTGKLSMLDTGLASAVLGGAAPGEGGFVTIDATAKDGDGAGLLKELETLGLTVGSSFGAMASGVLPVAEIAALAGLADLGFAQESISFGDAGKVTSQGDAAMLSDLARTTYGVDGTGISIGVLSDSFNAKGGMAGDQASGDLPANTTVVTGKDYASGTDEGRAMAQIVHDVAPGASILFETAFVGGQAGFANNIIDLANHGAKVIVDDVTYFAEPAYQDGPIAQAIAQVVANGAVYFTSAANNGNNGFEAAFKDSGSTYSGESLAQLNSAQGPGLALTLPAHTQTYLTLQWNQPSASVSPGHGSASDVDLFVFDATTGVLVKESIADNIASGIPYEQILLQNTSGSAHGYLVEVGLFSGPAPTDFKLIALDNGAGATFAASTLNTNDGTIFGHAAAADAIAVGAAYYQETPQFGTNPALVEDYSSKGPDTIYFDTSGNPLSTPDVREGPAVMAPDGVDTTFFVSGVNPDGDAFPNFFGTSAAAPHAAAVAALMLQANAALNASDIRNLMEDSASDMDDPTTAGFDKGFDNATGAGLLQANLAVGYAQSLTLTADASHPALFGTHLSDTFIGGAGSHKFDGGGGNDILDYSGAAGPVNLDASAGTASNGFGGTDTFANFEFFRGSSFADTLKGGDGNDTLDGNGGGDTVAGGKGDDTYIVDDPLDVVQENAGEGSDTIKASLSFNLNNAPNVENLILTGTGDFSGTGNALANLITGNDGNNILDGGAGADTLAGGKGNDIYVLDNPGDLVNELSGEGTDEIQSALVLPTFVANVENYTYTGAKSWSFTADDGDNVLKGGSGSDKLNGGGGNDQLFGNNGTDTLNGGAGDDILAGGFGGDTLVGGSGNDTYVVDNAKDVIQETGSDTADAIQASISISLANYVGIENVTLTGLSALNATGDAGVNTLTGNDAANVLDGQGGADVMAGHKGNDTYHVDNPGDQVIENAGEGTDTIVSSIDFDLSVSGLNVENLTLTGAAIHGTGNALNNQIKGDDLDNILDGGAGNDTMTGGLGNDTYIVDSKSDKVVEGTDPGIDTVQSSVSYTLSANVENLTLTGHTNINAIGNGLDNLLIGNDHNNTLNGGAGNDTLEGGGGNDTFTGGLGADTFLFESLADATTGKVTDFTRGAGGDVLNVHDLLAGFSGYDGTNAFSGGYLEFSASGSNTVVKVDADGGGDNFQTLVTITKVTLTETDTANYVT